MSCSEPICPAASARSSSISLHPCPFFQLGDGYLFTRHHNCYFLLRSSSASLLLSMSSILRLLLYLLFVCSYLHQLLQLSPVPSQPRQLCYSPQLWLGCGYHVLIHNPKICSLFKIQNKGPNRSRPQFLDSSRVNHKSLSLFPSPHQTPCPILTVHLQSVAQTRAPTPGPC